MIPLGQRHAILELTEETCRWPIGDPGSTEFFFCSGYAIRCALLQLVAYEPTGDRHSDRG